jgi:plastocyanin
VSARSGGGMGRREALVLMGAGVLAACFSDRTTGPDGDGDVTVDMTDDLVFSPASITITVGQTVRWRNQSAFPHSATGDPAKANDPANVQLPSGAAAFDSGVLAAGGEFTHTFTVPGQYRYFCIPHEAQGMVGTITVNA